MRSPVVVGRDGELRRLHHALEEAQAGQGGCLFVLGEAGSGKSRLLHEAQQEAARRAMTVMSGSVAPNVAAPALGVVVQALRSWTRSHPLPQAELAPFAVALHQALPEWPPPSDPPDLSDAQMRLLVVEGVLRLLLLAAGSEGAVVILDDLHDADPETFEFLHHAAPAAATERLLIVGAVRTGEGRRGESAARAVVRSGAADLLELGHLDDSAVAAMVEALLGAPAPPGLVVDLLARTDGVPLLMEEMLAAHLAAGTIRRENRSVRWSPGSTAVVPATIVEIVREKLDRLRPDALLGVVSVALLGHFDLPILTEVTGLEGPRLLEELQWAAEEGLIEATVHEGYRFRHALIREAVVENLPTGSGVDLERRTAEALDALHGEDEEWFEAVVAAHRQGLGAT